MAENQQGLYRKQALEHISSPEQLTDYLRVTNPGIWVILAAVILLLAGIFAWSAVGTLETSADVSVIVQDNTAQVIPSGGEKIDAGMPLRVSGQEITIASAEEDEYGRVTGIAGVSLPDGTYEGTVVTDRTRPIEFLLTSS